MLKIAKPNEFDLVFKLRIPHYREIIVTRDSEMPGNVLLDITRVLQLLKSDPREDQQNIRRLLKSLVNAQNFLIVEKLHHWLQSLFSRTLNRLDHRIVVDGKASKLKYRTCGPAHTIEVEGMEYSVDFVPAIRLDAEQNVFRTEQLNYHANIHYWDAIPKPLKKPLITESISFRSSFYDAEKAMLRGKHENCRNVIKCIKKFRDVQTNLHNLKSYFIKTVFLWKIRFEPESYWYKPLTVILIDMFEELTDRLMHGRLDYFWDPKLNMLDIYSRNQTIEMFRCVQGMSGKLRRVAKARNPTYRSLLSVLQAFSHREERIAIPRCYTRKSHQKRQSNRSCIIPQEIINFTTGPKRKTERIQIGASTFLNPELKNFDIYKSVQTMEKFRCVQGTVDKLRRDAGYTIYCSLLSVLQDFSHNKEWIAIPSCYPRKSYPKRKCVKRLNNHSQ
ncbi:uncharacterized protein LOC6591157 isoform X1 [Drosophila persimilis]|uniref:uncharacterized protein LOC6591157 isoform X1 n=1 Tax=Drosophila persimilis TaxID=7234 RepID=UPI000F0929BC|nr:uncharacterized protein LOC6591157 isoform X1 [Drosophila persimilis]